MTERGRHRLPTGDRCKQPLVSLLGRSAALLQHYNKASVGVIKMNRGGWFICLFFLALLEETTDPVAFLCVDRKTLLESCSVNRNRLVGFNN